MADTNQTRGGSSGEEKNSATKALQKTDNGDITIDTEEKDEGALRYTLTQIPPIPHVLISLASALTISAVISDTLCVDASHGIRAQLFATTLIMSGTCTILQTLLGVRLPVFQGPSSSFLVSLVGLSNLPSWRCPDPSAANTTLTDDSGEFSNTTTAYSMESYTMEEKLQQLSGSLMVASLLEVSVGGLGLIRPLMTRIGPITVAPTIGLIGLSLFKLPVVYAKYNPAIALGSAVMVIVFSLYMSKVTLPLPGCTKGGKRHHLQIFQLFPILLAMVVMWVICGVLTVTDVFPNDRDHALYLSRTDARTSIISTTPWFYVPYPGQFGPPSISLAATVGFFSATVASLVESVGDYLAAAKCCRVMSPPNHAISRGILMEGVGSFLSGAAGAAHATTSYSGNIAMLKLTKTASRSVLVLAGCILIALSVMGKVGAALATLPPPILGGILLVVLGLLSALGISTLTFADMNSTRNMLITGTAFLTGLSVPEFIDKHGDMLLTGNTNADQAIHIILGTPMFLGGLVALILDNTVPGTDAERGMLSWKTAHSSASGGSDVTEEEEDSLENKEQPNGKAPHAEKDPAAENATSVFKRRISRRILLTEDEVYCASTWSMVLKTKRTSLSHSFGKPAKDAVLRTCFKKTRKAMYQQRRKQFPKLSKSRAETHKRIADYDMTSSRGEPMVQVNDAANGIIIYTTNTNLQLLCDRQSKKFVQPASFLS
ncbi:hypothetical protein ACOMHN_044417 [Nucella lapillus]